jgi:hypothetical protein
LIEEQESEDVNHEEYYQEEHEFPCEHAKEEHFHETHHVEDLIQKEAPHEEKDLVFYPPFDEVIQTPVPPVHNENNMVSYTPFQDFDDALYYDSESEDMLEEPLDALNPSCYDKGNDVIDDIDEFIHVGRRKWDVICPSGDPIYNIEGHFQLFPLKQPYQIVIDSEAWQHEIDMITNLFQPHKNDLLYHYHDDFWSYPRGVDTYSFEHLDLFYEENFLPPLCSNFDEGKDMIFPKQDFCDKSLALSYFTLLFHYRYGWEFSS